MKRGPQHHHPMASTTPDATAQKIMVTPAMAREFCAHANQTRVDLPSGFFRKRMEMFMRAMMAGRWHYNRLDPVAFDTVGRLVNGRHRMEALSRCPDNVGALPFAVLRGLSDDEARQSDRARPKTMADALGVDRDLAALANTVWLTCIPNNLSPSDDELVPYVERVRPIHEAMARMMGGAPKRKRIWSSSPIRTAIVVLGLERGIHSAHFAHAVNQLMCVMSREVEVQRGTCNAVASLKNQFEGDRALAFTRLDVMARALLAFDLDHANATRVQLKNRDLYSERVRAQFKDLVAAGGARELPDPPEMLERVATVKGGRTFRSAPTHRRRADAMGAAHGPA